MINPYEALAASLSGIPKLTGCKCKGRSHIWESDEPELQEYALHQCGQCEARPECVRWFEGLKPSERPLGVCAGVVVREQRPPAKKPDGPRKKRGRPRKRRHEQPRRPRVLFEVSALPSPRRYEMRMSRLSRRTARDRIR